MNLQDDDDIVLTTAIRSDIMAKTIIKGTLIASFGLLLMLYVTVFLPASQLKQIGFFLFFVSFGAITFGLLKYRRLQRIESYPFQLKVNNESIRIERKGLLLLTIFWCDVLHIGYRDIPKKSVYGIEVVVKEKISTKELFQEGDQTFFLPFFTIRSFKKLDGIFFAKKKIGPSTN